MSAKGVATKTFRLFSILTAILLVIGLFFGARYWANMPKRTAQAFVDAIIEGRDADAAQLFDGSSAELRTAMSLRELWEPVVTPDPRAWQDVILGRQGFNRFYGGLSITDLYVERGKVTSCCCRGMVQYYPAGPVICHEID